MLLVNNKHLFRLWKANSIRHSGQFEVLSPVESLAFVLDKSEIVLGQSLKAADYCHSVSELINSEIHDLLVRYVQNCGLTARSVNQGQVFCPYLSSGYKPFSKKL